MKVRVTLMTENDAPAEEVGKTAEERNRTVEAGWRWLLDMLRVLRIIAGETSDRIELESAEVLDDTESERSVLRDVPT